MEQVFGHMQLYQCTVCNACLRLHADGAEVHAEIQFNTLCLQQALVHCGLKTGPISLPVWLFDEACDVRIPLVVTAQPMIVPGMASDADSSSAHPQNMHEVAQCH